MHKSLEQEPHAEVVVARRISKTQSIFRAARNIRRLHFELSSAEGALAYEVGAKDKREIPRAILARHQPDRQRTLPPDATNTLVAWIIGRYERQAFPDAFQERIKPIEKDLRKAIAELIDVEALFIRLHSYDELPPAESYRIELLFAMRDEIYNEESARLEVERILNKIRILIGDLPGIELENDDLRSEARISLHELRSLRRWGDFDFLTLEGKD